MEKFWLISVSIPTSNRGMLVFRYLAYFVGCCFVLGCQAKYLKVENAGQLANIEEYDKKIKIKEIPVEPGVAEQLAAQQAQLGGTPSATDSVSMPASTLSSSPGGIDAKNDSKKAKEKLLAEKKLKEKIEQEKKKALAKASQKRLPEIEDSEGFIGRRPIVDPFWIGEKTVLAMSYFGAKAGEMTMSVDPYVEVNGKKSYHFSATIKSAPFFSTFYAVDDYGETFVDFFDMTPFNILIKVKESGQLREVRSFFDWKTMKANYWERKVTKQRGTEEKKHEWDIPPYTHNAFSAAYYLRTFKLTPGKVIQYHVADENRNMIVKANVLRREEIETDAGKFNTVVIRPEVAMDGVFTPMGDVFFWLTDDDRKLYVRIEAKIKIGTIKAEAIKVIPGVKPQP